MNVLLHSCCGPCASACVPRLKEAGHAVTMFYSNSNIDTRAEFEKRLAAARTLAAAEGVTLVADDYDHAAWLRAVADGYENEPEKGRRCERCYRYNLARTAAYAAAESDELSDTVDYAALTEKVRAALVAAKCRMIERAAKVVCDLCREDPKVHAATVRIVKAGAVAHLASAAVTYSSPSYGIIHTP